MQYSSQGGKRSRGRQSKVAGIAVALLFVLYSAAAPRLNQRFGWKLPVLGQVQEVADQDFPDQLAPGPSRSDRDSESENVFNSESDASSAVDARSPPAHGGLGSDVDQARDWLRETSPNVYLSPAGLIYGPGSAEGHRLEHVRRHAADIPSRRGPHGVFEGGFLTSLKTIDEAWTLAKKSMQTEKKVDGRRTIYKVDLQREIGFVGGMTGKSRGRPPVTVVMLVLEGNRVITAYPVESKK